MPHPARLQLAGVAKIPARPLPPCFSSLHRPGRGITAYRWKLALAVYGEPILQALLGLRGADNASPPSGSYLQLLRMCEGLPSLATAVVHPCSEDALIGAIEAAKVNLITPILVGPEKRIRAVAAEAGVDISPYRLVAAQHSTAVRFICWTRCTALILLVFERCERI